MSKEYTSQLIENLTINVVNWQHAKWEVDFFFFKKNKKHFLNYKEQFSYSSRLITYATKTFAEKHCCPP